VRNACVRYRVCELELERIRYTLSPRKRREKRERLRKVGPLQCSAAAHTGYTRARTWPNPVLANVVDVFQVRKGKFSDDDDDDARPGRENEQKIDFRPVIMKLGA